MKIEINLKIIFFAILFFLLNQIEMYLIFIGSIILHEIAHMVVGMLLGLRQKSFSINPLGVSLEFYLYQERKRWKKVVTYLAGPVMNLIISVIFFMFDGYEEIIYNNLILAIFNLIPIMPLDGGKILKEIFVSIVGNKRATIFMSNLTKVILVIFTLIYSILILEVKNFAVFLLIIYLWYLKFIEDKKVRTMMRAYKIIEGYKN